MARAARKTKQHNDAMRCKKQIDNSVVLLMLDERSKKRWNRYGHKREKNRMANLDAGDKEVEPKMQASRHPRQRPTPQYRYLAHTWSVHE